jgi:hypothetical protein
MARYTGPVCSLCRSECVSFFLKATDFTHKMCVEKRAYAPGHHDREDQNI